MTKVTRSYLVVLIAIVLGVATGLWKQKFLLAVAGVISTLFLNYLSMIAAPIVLLAILSTLLGMPGFHHMKTLGKKVITYTLLTTFLAATIALFVFLALNPVAAVVHKGIESVVTTEPQSYLHFFVEIIPSNIFRAFLENKVISIAFLAFLFGIAAHFIPENDRKTLFNGVSALFQLFLKIAEFAVYVIPIAIWSFMVLLVQEIQEKDAAITGLWVYLATVVLANLVQGVVVIPLLLKLKGISPWRLAKGSMRALSVAFFTKSSNATLPVTLKVAKEELHIRPEIANFSLPLCTVINMNGCAAFILTTILFVAGVHGHVFSPVDLALWVVLAVIAAVGNAGVPMGCFFLSSAFLISMDIPLTLMGLILPFYTLIDMEETALNVWSDLSVTAIADRELPHH